MLVRIAVIIVIASLVCHSPTPGRFRRLRSLKWRWDSWLHAGTCHARNFDPCGHDGTSITTLADWVRLRLWEHFYRERLPGVGYRALRIGVPNANLAKEDLMAGHVLSEGIDPSFVTRDTGLSFLDRQLVLASRKHEMPSFICPTPNHADTLVKTRTSSDRSPEMRHQKAVVSSAR